MQLYHVTNTENFESIRESGLRAKPPCEYETSVVDVAREAVDDRFDTEAEAKFGDAYNPREGSVFFHADPVVAVREAANHDAAVVVVDVDECTCEALWFTERTPVEREVGARIGEHVESISEDGVEGGIEFIVDELTEPWSGEPGGRGTDEIEVWGVSGVDSEAIRNIWVPSR